MIDRQSDQTTGTPEHESLRSRFEVTTVPFMGRLYNTALRLTRRQDDAHDLVQETYLRAYRTFEHFVPGTNCKAWLFTVMYSVFINRYRKEKREPPLISLDEMEKRFHATPVTGVPEVEDLWARGVHVPSASVEVDQALGQLPESFRSVVLFVDVEELSYEEAAVVLQCPVGTVRSRLYRARRMLFLTLRPYAERAGYLKAIGSRG